MSCDRMCGTPISVLLLQMNVFTVPITSSPSKAYSDTFRRRNTLFYVMNAAPRNAETTPWDSIEDGSSGTVTWRHHVCITWWCPHVERHGQISGGEARFWTRSGTSDNILIYFFFIWFVKLGEPNTFAFVVILLTSCTSQLYFPPLF